MFGQELIRWNPFDELRALRAERWPFERQGDTLPSVENLPLDIYEKDGALVVRAAIPGVKKEDVDITISDDVLRIRAEKKEEKEVKREDFYLREYTSGTWSRSVRLPANLQNDKAKAAYDNGYVTLTIPRRAESKPRSVKVDVGS